MSYVRDSGPDDAPYRLILAHGAGAGVDSLFLAAIVTLLVERGIAVTCFEFDYMAARRFGAKKRPPPKTAILTLEYEQMVRSVAAQMPQGQTLVIGGKSLGGRVASLISDQLFREGLVSGLVCFGFPVHPPNTPGTLRTAHLETLICPALIVQGERDPFGNRAEVEALNLPDSINLAWIGDGDHDFGPRGASGFTRKGNLANAADAVAAFLAGLKQAR